MTPAAIPDLYATIVHATTGDFGQVNANELCVGSTCVTPQEFQATVAAANQSGTGAIETDSPTPPPSSSNGNESSSADSSATPPVLQVNGDNPAIIQVGATYTDLGAQITGPQADLNLGITTYVNGAPMNPIQLDTTQAATDTIAYVVTDSAGLTSTSTRTVIIEAADAPSIVLISFTRCAASRFRCSGSVIPNALIASLIASSASGASTYPINAAGVARMRVTRHSYIFLLGPFGMLTAIQTRRAEHESPPRCGTQ